jgi:lysophospholipase L1-like esterase
VRDTLRLEYKTLLSDEELVAFSNFMAAHYPDYPGWSETNYFRDYTQINAAGYPLWIHTMKKPEHFYQAYLEFKNTKR